MRRRIPPLALFLFGAACSAGDTLPESSRPGLSGTEGEALIPSVAEQMRRFAAAGRETWVAAPGTHGSSTLNPLRVPDLPATAWLRIRAFLERHTPR